MSEERPPDFAMLRALDILERIANQKAQPVVPVVPVAHPVEIACDKCTFAIGKTRRSEIEYLFGRGYAYPAKGFHTYAVAPHELPPEAGVKRCLLSVFYRGDLLFGIEHYIPRVKGIPPLSLSPTGALRVVPGEFKLGGALRDLGYFVPAQGGPSPIIYAQSFEARFSGGVAWLMGNDAQIERIAIYGDA